MAAPRVSVVIDNFNYGRYLPAALDSVLAQDVPKESLEIIVVDDGSTDESRDVLSRYAPRVRGVLQSNQGYAAAFNRGFAEARGEIVCLLDSDDTWAPDKVRKVLERLDREPELGAVQHFLADTDAALRPLGAALPAWPDRYVLEDYLDGRLEFGATSGLSVRRELALKLLPIPTELRFLYADNYLVIGTLLSTPVGNLPEALGCHRIHGSNFCAGTYADGKKLAADLAMEKIFDRSVERWLAERGRVLTPRHVRLRALETLRREVLWRAHSGRRLAAAATLARGLASFGADPFALFRALTCSLAVVSPKLYLWAHERYARSPRAKALRSRVISA